MIAPKAHSQDMKPTDMLITDTSDSNLTLAIDVELAKARAKQLAAGVVPTGSAAGIDDIDILIPPSKKSRIVPKTSSKLTDEELAKVLLSEDTVKSEYVVSSDGGDRSDAGKTASGQPCSSDKTEARDAKSSDDRSSNETSSAKGDTTTVPAKKPLPFIGKRPNLKAVRSRRKTSSDQAEDDKNKIPIKIVAKGASEANAELPENSAKESVEGNVVPTQRISTNESNSEVVDMEMDDADELGSFLTIADPEGGKCHAVPVLKTKTIGPPTLSMYLLLQRTNDAVENDRQPSDQTGKSDDSLLQNSDKCQTAINSLLDSQIQKVGSAARGGMSAPDKLLLAASDSLEDGGTTFSVDVTAKNLSNESSLPDAKLVSACEKSDNAVVNQAMSLDEPRHSVISSSPLISLPTSETKQMTAGNVEKSDAEACTSETVQSCPVLSAPVGDRVQAGLPAVGGDGGVSATESVTANRAVSLSEPPESCPVSEAASVLLLEADSAATVVQSSCTAHAVNSGTVNLVMLPQESDLVGSAAVRKMDCNETALQTRNSVKVDAQPVSAAAESGEERETGSVTERLQASEAETAGSVPGLVESSWLRSGTGTLFISSLNLVKI